MTTSYQGSTVKYGKMTTSYQGSTIKTTFCFNSNVFQCPDTVEEWHQVAIGFQAQWNFLRTECCEVYMVGIDQEGLDHDTLPGRWRQDPGLQQASLPHTTNSTIHAKQLRDKLCQYFNSDIGAVPFQWGKI